MTVVVIGGGPAVADSADLADSLIARPHDNSARLRDYDQRRLTAGATVQVWPGSIPADRPRTWFDERLSRIREEIISP
jgi:hypothetical protein